jgi:hypothetical protein
MKRRTIGLILAFAITALSAAGIGAYAASTYGTSSDPLITLSYLTGTLTPSLMGQFQEQLSSEVAELQKEIDAAGGGSADSYKVISLKSGQVVTGGVGCEVLLRVGTAVCQASYSPGLVDMTGGGTLDSGGSLAANHLYLVTIEGGGLKATASTVMVLIRGSYTVS